MIATPEIIAAIVIVLFAGVVRGFSGFGFSAICVASLSFFMPPLVIVPVVLIMEILASIWMLPGVWREVNWQWLTPTTAGLAIGTPAGLILLAFLPPDTTRSVLYVGLILLSLAAIFRARTRSPLPDSSASAAAAPPLVSVGFVAIGIAAGIANGMIALAGMVCAVFLLSARYAPEQVRASLIALFLIGDVYAIALGNGFGLIHADQVQMAAILTIPMLVGIDIGRRFFRAREPVHYHRIALTMVLAIASAGLLRQLAVLIG